MNLLPVLQFLLNNKVPIVRISAAVIIFLTFILARKIITERLFNLLVKLAAKTKGDFDDKLVSALKTPAEFFLIVLGAYLASGLAPLHFAITAKIFRSALIILTAMALRNMVDNYTLLFNRVETMLKIEIDKILIPFFSKVLKTVIGVSAIILIAQEWDYDVNGFITGLGLGGLAFALAAKDTAANIFGGIVIIMDKPFSIGDWIYTPSVEGTVETINFRSTKVRTFAQALVTVPNATLVNEPVTNWSRMGKRRITFKLGVNYSTTKDQLESCTNQIRAMLAQHPEIDRNTIFVTFEAFSESSLDIFLYFFTKSTDWGRYLMVKEDINYKIMEILEREEVSVAFPSTSVYFENILKQNPVSTKNYKHIDGVQAKTDGA